MMFRATLLCSLAISTAPAWAQGNVPFDKEHITDKSKLEEALTAMKAAEKFAQAGGKDYGQAIALYEKAYAVNPDNADLNVRLGLCHLNGQQRHLAMPYFQKAVTLDPQVPRAHYLAGMALQLNAKWDEAIWEFEAHKRSSMGLPDENPVYNQAEKHLSECRNGKSLMANPTSAQVTNLGPRVNSVYSDYGAVLAHDGQTMWFTSRRENSTGGKVNKSTNQYFEDVYTSTLNDGAWSAPEPLPPPVNTEMNDASVGMDHEGDRMIIYRDVKVTGDLLESKRAGSNWGTPEPFGTAINTKFHESSACYSQDGKWLYFVSDREGGLGGQDIYRSAWDATTKAWKEAENLGPDVNSRFDEDGIFVQGDGATIYFSSKGHTSMGGYDVFRSDWKDGRWSKPENLGWPINSPDDDLFMVLVGDGSKGYYSSFRPGGEGEDDLYEVIFAKP